MQARNAQNEATFINISIAKARAVELVKLRRAAEIGRIQSSSKGESMRSPFCVLALNTQTQHISNVRLETCFSQYLDYIYNNTLSLSSTLSLTLPTSARIVECIRSENIKVKSSVLPSAPPACELKVLSSTDERTLTPTQYS